MLVATNETAEELYGRIKPHLDALDRVLIAEFQGDYWGSLPKDAWEWVEQTRKQTVLTIPVEDSQANDAGRAKQKRRRARS